MQFSLKVINVDRGDGTNSRGGKYKYIEVSYKRADTGKVEGKRVMDFVSAEVFKAANAVEIGKDYTVTLEKDGKGYWQWTNISEGAVTSDYIPPTKENVSAPTVSAPNKASVGTVSRSNYETSDERAARQRSIVAQSSVSSAIGFLEGNKSKSVDSIFEVADRIYEFVNSKSNSSNTGDRDIPILKKTGFEDMENDIPL